MSVTCVVQARTGSSRLPGKVLAELGGRPMLGFLLTRLAPLGAEHLVVATTEHSADDAVAEVATAAGVGVVRGPETDVLGRVALALDRFPAAAVVRLTADCPLTDPALVRRALAVQEATAADYVSNTLVRTYPDGLDVEVMSAGSLRAAAAEAADPVEREHVTPFLYRRPERFTLRTFRHAENLASRRWTVDTAEDLAHVRAVVDHLGRIDFGWEDVLAIAEPVVPAGDQLTLVPAEPGDADALLALRNDADAIRNSRSGRAVARDEHAAWFARTIESPGSRVWLAHDGAGVAGQVRIDVRTGVGTVSLAVDPRRRQCGVGTRILRRLFEALAADEQVHTLLAEVHRDNEASGRLFAGAGFVEDRRDGDFRVMRWSRPAP